MKAILTNDEGGTFSADLDAFAFLENILPYSECWFERVDNDAKTTQFRIKFERWEPAHEYSIIVPTQSGIAAAVRGKIAAS